MASSFPVQHAIDGRPRGIPSNRPSTLLAHATLLLGASAAVFLVGAEQGSLGIFLVCAGVALVCCPPRVRVDWRLWAAAGASIAASALALLPAHWFHAPTWRAALEAVPAIHLPASVSPMPWETGFWLAVMALSALIGLFALAHPMRTTGLIGVVMAAVIACAIYTALAIYSRQTGWRYPFAGTATFGFFPNRNHTATLLVVGSILAMGLLRVAWRDGRWVVGMLAGGGLALFVTALGFYSASRGGIVFLLVGTAMWVAGLGRRERSAPVLISLGVLLLAAGFLFVLSGSEVRNRLLPAWMDADTRRNPGREGTQNPPSTEKTAPDFRVFIYEDAFRMVREAPLTGVGLGAFAAVFPQYRQSSLSDTVALHPESDWLMLAAEAGVPAAVLVGLLWVMLLGRSRHWRTHPSWPLRWACVAAVLAAGLHGMVDVPLHRVVLGWWVLVLAGAAMHGGWSEDTGRSRVQHALFAAGGLLALMLGIGLIRAQWFGTAPLPPCAAQAAREQIYKMIERQDYAEAASLCRRAIAESPLFEPLYFQKGLLQVQAEEDAASDETFRAQRVLDPILPSIPFSQGELWINDDPVRAAGFWREALIRARRINLYRGRGESELGLYHEMVVRASGKMPLELGLLEFADGRADMTLSWLENNPTELVAPQVARLVADKHFIDALDRRERRRFLSVWYAHGDRAALSRWLEEDSSWQEASWPVRFRLLVDAQCFEAAVRGGVEHYGIPLALPPADSAAMAPAAIEEDTDPAAAFAACWRSGNEVSARRILSEAGFGRTTPVSPELLRWRLAVQVHDANWPDAWQALAQYLSRTERAGDLAP